MLIQQLPRTGPEIARFGPFHLYLVETKPGLPPETWCRIGRESEVGIVFSGSIKMRETPLPNFLNHLQMKIDNRRESRIPEHYGWLRDLSIPDREQRKWFHNVQNEDGLRNGLIHEIEDMEKESQQTEHDIQVLHALYPHSTSKDALDVIATAPPDVGPRYQKIQQRLPSGERYLASEYPFGEAVHTIGRFSLHPVFHIQADDGYYPTIYYAIVLPTETAPIKVGVMGMDEDAPREFSQRVLICQYLYQKYLFTLFDGMQFQQARGEDVTQQRADLSRISAEVESIKDAYQEIAVSD